MWKQCVRLLLISVVLGLILAGGAAAQAEIPSVTVAITADGLTAPQDNVARFFEAADTVYALVALISSVGGRTDTMLDKALALANSIEFTGTAKDILAGLGGE